MNSASHDKGGICRKLKNKRKNQSQAMINTVLVTKVTYVRNYYRLERRHPDKTTKKDKGQFRSGTKFLQRFYSEEGRLLSFTNSRNLNWDVKYCFLLLGINLRIRNTSNGRLSHPQVMLSHDLITLLPVPATSSLGSLSETRIKIGIHFWGGNYLKPSPNPSPHSHPP